MTQKAITNGRPDPLSKESLESLTTWSQRYRSSLLGFFKRRTPRQVDCEDLVQEVFLRLAQRRHLEDIQNVEGYLFHSAAGVLTDWRRRGAVRHSDAHVTLDFDLPDVGVTPERVLMGREDLSRLIATVAEMPPRTQAIFSLYHFEHKSHAEISRLLGIAVRTVEDHMGRANALLLQARESAG